MTGAIAACGGDERVAPIEASYSVSINGGDGQRGPAGGALAQPLTVVVRDADGVAVKGVKVLFRVEKGAATGSRVLDSVSVTSTAGIARADLVLGSVLDSTIVLAFPAPAPQRSARFASLAIAGPRVVSASPSPFAAGDTITLRGSGFGGFVSAGLAVEVAGVRLPALGGATDSTVRAIIPACLAPGAVEVRVTAGGTRSNAVGGDYRARAVSLAMTPLQVVTVDGSQLAECITVLGGAAYLIAAQFASAGSGVATVDWRLGASGVGAVPQESERPPIAADVRGAQRVLESYLRRAERVIAPQARSEAAGSRGGGVLFQPATAPPALGSTRDFKVLAALDGTAFTSVRARLRYAGEHVLFYTDTVAAGFTDEQYQSLGALFDRDLYGIDVAAFGSESDVDRDGRVLALFTPAVNRLVRAQDCGQFGFVTGFFYGLDLLLDNPNSNRSEIFYSFVPDSAARFSCAHSTRDVLTILPGTFVHELQHMISFNQHVLARLGGNEETWLNEGLSHMAEELGSRYYEAKFPPPLGRATTLQIYPDSAGPFIAPQLLNAYVYLNSTRTHSVTSYVSTGSIEERGATWLFLKWLVEQKGDDVLRRLVQTPKVGITNVEAQSGESFSALFGDFSVMLWIDSLPLLSRSIVPPRYQFGARSLRRLMAREAVVSGFSNPFPLSAPLLVAGLPQLGDMLPGTMSLSQLRPATGLSAFALQFARQDFSAFARSLGAQVTIVRLPP